MGKQRGSAAVPAAAACTAALAYAALGWSVIPIEPGGKRPLVPWLDFQHRIAGCETVDGWFRRWPDANVGIVTGRVSGLVVVDVDPRHGGEASLAQAQRAHGPVPATVQAETGGGGRHLYFGNPGSLLHNRVGILPGIDLRADGGCVVAPPSLHPSGRHYCWIAGCAPGESPLAPLPPWLLALAHDGARRGHPTAHWRDLVRQELAEGSRNSTLASLAGHLLWRGVDPEVVLELMLAFNRTRGRPPLADEEVAQVVASVARLHQRGEHGASGRGS